MPRPTARSPLRHLFSGAVLLLVSAASAPAEDRPQVAATRATAPLRVDGALDEPDWRRAEPIRDLRLIYTREGETPSESTEVRVLFDDKRIYFGFRCANRGPGAIRASLTPRDQCLDDDNVAVHLDTFRDRRRAYLFVVSPYGVQADGILTGTEAEFEWDGVWEAEARRDARGWTAEIAIPFRILRFPERGGDVWGLWFRRQITKCDEVCSWPLWKQSVSGDIMLQAADLGGLAGVSGGGRVEIQPYAASTHADVREPAGGTIGPWSRNRDDQAGLDLRFAPTPMLVLNGTLNPDYSQVEADALQFDLNQRYPLFFPEKRPFFLEGADFFSTPIQFVHTRRIANPDYGFKATGTLGNVRLGWLVARDVGGGSLAGTGAGPGEGVATRGMFEIGRAALEVGEQSSVGVLLAAHQTEGASLLAPPSSDGTPYPDGGANLLLAADWRIRLAKPLFLSGQVARSHTDLDTARFDLGWDSLGFGIAWDRRRRSFTDLAFDARLEWNDGIRYLTLYQDYRGPDLRAETGFLSQIDVRKIGFRGVVSVRPENAWLRVWMPILDANVWHDAAGVLQQWYVSPMVDWQFQKQSHLHTMVERIGERWQGRYYDQNRWILVADNSLWRPLAIELNGEVGEGIYYGETDADSYLGWMEEYNLEATARPTPRLTSEIVVERNRFSRRRWHGTVYDVWLMGAKTTFQFTRRLYARVYPQYDTDSEHLEAGALLGYVVHPGTVLYLGVNHGLDAVAGERRTTQRTVFVKASYAWVR